MTTPILNATATDRVGLIDEIFTKDPGLTGSDHVTQEALDAGRAAAQGILSLIQDALSALHGSDPITEITSQDVLAINAYLQADPDRYAQFLAFHGDDEGGVETGFHLIQGDGATTRLFQKNAVNTVFDGIFHIGFDVVDGRFLNEDGHGNATLTDVAHWLDYLYADIASTGTGLDGLTNAILLDPGLRRANPADQVTAGARAADGLNHLIVDALDAVAADAMAAERLSLADIRAVSTYINTNHFAEFVALHGDDEDGVETGFHLVQGDGGRDKLYDRAMVNTVADGIYHLGFGTNAAGNRLLNEDGNPNAELSHVAAWLSGLLFGTEVITGTNRGRDTLLGTDADEIFLGEGGNDEIHAGGGDDVIYGGRGNDRLYGDAGDDLFVIEAGNQGMDTVLGGEGQDTLDVSVSSRATLLRGGFGTANSIEMIQGDGTSVLVGGRGADLLDFSATQMSGVALISGRNGNDVILGSTGDDHMDGGAGDDQLAGGDGDDVLDGGRGADVLTGGIGNDTLTGGRGADTFVFAQGDGQDGITDFNSMADQVVLSGFAIASFAALQALAQDQGGDLVIDFGGSDSLTLEGISLAQLQADDFGF